MKVKKLIELLSVLKPDTEVKIMDFNEKAAGLIPIEYKIDIIEKSNFIYTDGYSGNEHINIYISKKMTTKR